jgi:hypothetical protein
MRAEEARRLTEKNLRGPVIDGILKVAYERIKNAAKDGKSSVNHPFYDAYPSPSPEAVEAALTHLKSIGYKVTHHTNTDPERGSDWDRVSW